MSEPKFRPVVRYMVATPDRYRFMRVTDGEASWVGAGDATVFGNEHRARVAASLPGPNLVRHVVELVVGQAVYAPVEACDQQVPDVPWWVHNPFAKKGECKCDDCRPPEKTT